MIGRLSAKPVKIGPLETFLLYSIAGPKSLPPFQKISSIDGNTCNFKFCTRECIYWWHCSWTSQFEHPSNACTMSGIKIMSLFQISILVGGSSASYLPWIYWSLQGIIHMERDYCSCVCESISYCHVWWKWSEANVFIFCWYLGWGVLWALIMCWGGKIIVIMLVVSRMGNFSYQ